MTENTLEEKKNRLLGDIDGRRKKQEKRRRNNRGIFNTLVIGGILLSLGAAIAGFSGMAGGAQAAAILALLAGASITLESAFKFGEKADFYRILVGEFDNLRIALRYAVDTEEKLELIVKKFQTAITVTARSLPRGQGMSAVKTLYEELDRHGILVVPEVEATS